MTELTLAEKTAKEAREIEEMESQDELSEQVTDIEVTVSLDGTVKEITVFYNSRNIKVGVDLYRGTVNGYSHGRHRTSIMDEDTETLLKHLGDFYKQQYEAARKTE